MACRLASRERVRRRRIRIRVRTHRRRLRVGSERGDDGIVESRSRTGLKFGICLCNAELDLRHKDPPTLVKEDEALPETAGRDCRMGLELSSMATLVAFGDLRLLSVYRPTVKFCNTILRSVN